MEASAQRFFTSKYYAVAGASQDPDKFGYKVLAWYHARKLPVTPITPSRPKISVLDYSYATVADVPSLPHPTETSISIITPPHITADILRAAKNAGVPCVWLQPGTYDETILAFAKQHFVAAVGGQHWCILIDGDAARAKVKANVSRTAVSGQL